MGFRKNHIAAAGEFCVFLRIQRSHVKFAFGRFDRRTAGFRLQRVDRHVFLRFDFRIACLSHERACVYAARCRFCGKRSRGYFSHFHRTTACQRCVFLCIQRSHIKFAFGCFDGCAAGFCLQRADRRICLCSDRRIACRSRERIRLHAAAGRDSKRACFCFVDRGIAICIDGRVILRAEFLDLEHAVGGDLRLSFFRDQGAVREGGSCGIGIGEIAVGGILAIFDRALIRDAHRPRFRSVRAGRQLAAVCDGHRSRFCGIGAVFDGSFIRDTHRPLRGVRAATHLARVGDVCGSAAKVAAGNGMILRGMDAEGFPCLVVAVRNVSTAGDGEVFGFDVDRLRCRLSEEGDVGIACGLRRDGARLFAAVFGFCAGHFHAEGRPIACAFDILGVCDGNILPFDVRICGTGFVAARIVSVFGEEAVFAHIETNVSFRSIDGIDDEIAVALLEGNAVFRSRSEDACAGDGHIRNFSSAGLDDGLFRRADGDAIDIAFGFETDFAGCGEGASGIHGSCRLQIDRALIRLCRQHTVGIGFDGVDRADGDCVAIDFEVTAFRCRQSEQFLRGQFVQISGREVDLLSVLLMSDAARILASLAAERGQFDILPGNMRRFFQCRLCIGNAFFDAARAEGDEQILCGLRRTDEDACFFVFREVGIVCKALFRERCLPVDRLFRIINGFTVGIDAFLRPSADAVFQRVIACLFVCDVLIDVGDALFLKRCFRAVVQCVLAVLDVGCQGLVFIVLAFDFRFEEGLLLFDGCVTAFENGCIRPSEKLCLRAFVRHITEVVVDEAAVCRQGDIAMLRGDAVEIQVSTLVRDDNISVRAGFETVFLAAALLCLDAEIVAVLAGDGSGLCGKLDTAAFHHRIRLLGQAALGGEGDGLRRFDRADRHIGCRRIQIEVSILRTAGYLFGTGQNRLVLTAHIIGGFEIQRFRLQEAFRCRCDGVPLDGCCAAYIGNRPGDRNIACPAVLVDLDVTAGFITVEADADGMACSSFVLLDMGLVVADDHFHVILLGQTDRIPAALGLDGVVNDIRFIEDIPLLRLAIADGIGGP